MGATDIDAAPMVKGRRLAVALAVIAVVAALADVFAGRASDSSPGAEGAARGAAALAAAAAVELGRPLAADVSRAAAVPQLRAALRAHVDAETIADLFASEDWGLPFRGRAGSIVTDGGVLLAAGAGDAPADSSLAAQAASRPGQPIAALRKVGDVVVVESAVVVAQVDEAPVLALVQTVKPAQLSAAGGGGALAVAD